MSDSAAQLRVGMIGYGFMGAVHSHAWQAVKRAFDVEAVPVLAVLCGRDRAGVEVAAKRYGFAETATDWREVVNARRHRRHRHLHARRQPYADRRRRAGRR